LLSLLFDDCSSSSTAPVGSSPKEKPREIDLRDFGGTGPVQGSRVKRRQNRLKGESKPAAAMNGLFVAPGPLLKLSVTGLSEIGKTDASTGRCEASESTPTRP
jgi:hypothetical protein